MAAKGTDTIATAPVKVDVRSVETELSDMWRKAAEGGMPGVTAPTTRVILSNILIYAATDSEANESARAIEEIAAEHPARTIIADAEPGKPGQELDADVSMLCSISEAGRRLCGESVRLHAHGISVTALGTILPVIVPDLPIYLWTPGNLNPTDPVYGQLMNIPDHWIVDSRRFSDYRSRFEMVTKLGIERKPPLYVHDLAWESLGRWREAIARHFDPRPARDYLPGVRSIEIKGREGIEPLLIAVWLASRLEWQEMRAEKSPEGMIITGKTESGEAQITIKPDDKAADAVQEVTIKAEANGKKATFRSAQSNGGIVIEGDGPDIANVRNTVVAEPASMSRAVCRILDAPDREWVYEKALRVLESIVRNMA